MTSARTFYNTIAGVEVRTTHLYSQYLTFDKVIDRVVEAMREGEQIEDGIYRYKYKSRVKTTNPYRTLLVNPIWTPNQILYVTDFPVGGHTGLITVHFENYHQIPEGEIIYTDKDTGMMYSIEPPKGWKE